MTTSASGGCREVLPGTDRSLPGMAENCQKKWKSQHCNLGTNACTCCCMTRTAVHVYCCVRTRRAGGVERRGDAKTVIPAPLWRSSTTLGIFLFFLFFSSAIPSPVSDMVPRIFCCTTAVVLLLYAHCGFVGCGRFFFAACCAVLRLLYYVQ